MATINSSVQPKKFPLQGIGEYFEKVGKFGHAKHTYKKALESPQASEADKMNAKSSIHRIDEKLRGTEAAKVDITTSILLPVKDLSPHPDVKMGIGSQDYDRLKKDVAERGIQVPLAVDMQNRVICGANRLKVAKELSIAEVPCFVLGLTDPMELKRYALADNVCRRQLSTKEKRAWVVELLRMRKEEVEHIRGRKKGTPSNREIAKMVGVDSATVDRVDKKVPHCGTIPKLVKVVNIIKEGFGDHIVKGKSIARDKTFGREMASKLEGRVDHILGSMENGEKLQVKIYFEYEEKG